MSTDASTAPWHAAYPVPASMGKLEQITSSVLKNIMNDESKTAGKDYLVVDVRRTDFENAFICGAVNLPAHSFYPTVESVAKLLSPIPLVVFHCNSCSDGGRGPRVAGWYTDELNRKGISSSRAAVLQGGIKGWISVYGDEPQLTTKL